MCQAARNHKCCRVKSGICFSEALNRTVFFVLTVLIFGQVETKYKGGSTVMRCSLGEQPNGQEAAARHYLCIFTEGKQAEWKTRHWRMLYFEVTRRCPLRMTCCLCCLWIIQSQKAKVSTTMHFGQSKVWIITPNPKHSKHTIQMCSVSHRILWDDAQRTSDHSQVLN